MKIKASADAIANNKQYKNVPLDFQIEFGNIAILVGKNNVGKSNILELIKTHNKKVAKKDAVNPKVENGYFELIGNDGKEIIFEDDEIIYFDTSEATDEFKDTAKSFLTTFRKEFFDTEIKGYFDSTDFKKISGEAIKQGKLITNKINKIISSASINPKYDIEYDVEFDLKDAYSPKLWFNSSNEKARHEFAGLGRGAQREVFFKLLNMMSERKSNNKRLFIFDEPEAFSNPTLIKEMCRAIKRMNEMNKNYYFIIATHSHIVCNEFIDHYESIFKIGNDGANGDNSLYVLGHIDASKIQQREQKFLEIISNNFKDHQAKGNSLEKFEQFKQVVNDVPLEARLKSWLSITNCDIFFADNVFLVEGPTEEMIFTLPKISTYLLSKNYELLILNGNFNAIFVLLLLDVFQIKNVAMLLDRDLKSSLKHNKKSDSYFLPTFDYSLSQAIKEQIDLEASLMFENIKQKNIEIEYAVENIEMELLGEEALYLETLLKDVQLMRFYNKKNEWIVTDIAGNEKGHTFYFDDDKILKIIKRFKLLK